jgi:hypothetical protein
MVFPSFKISIYISMGLSIGGVKMTVETMVFVKKLIPLPLFQTKVSHALAGCRIRDSHGDKPVNKILSRDAGYKELNSLAFYLNIQSVPRSKQIPSRF